MKLEKIAKFIFSFLIIGLLFSIYNISYANTTIFAQEDADTNYLDWENGNTACENYTETENPDVTWRLPTYPELVGHYLDHNNAGGPPTGFVDDSYWSGTTYPGDSDLAYNVYMNSGTAFSDYKAIAVSLVHCAYSEPTTDMTELAENLTYILIFVITGLMFAGVIYITINIMKKIV